MSGIYPSERGRKILSSCLSGMDRYDLVAEGLAVWVRCHHMCSQTSSQGTFMRLCEIVVPLADKMKPRIKKIEIKFGFGFVDYHDPKDAEDAISKLN
eukprot:7951061-Pyramimonas_sp.AAC.2